ncbi:phage tail spike protein [Qiania dongpingensis]|uniref:Phage tail protein n=1 Tax=Qiania dongpingensis TaxID=2763669 RepID=A0A7G9G6Y3_9FIRM|nr:phage tail spike protein [Qiania dongpingensis]QNM06565.1 phage tail protein [Qiania dongpingensis]
MIPILYEQNTRKFDTNGIGGLSGAVSCMVTEERNGSYELVMEYPVKGIHFSEIRLSAIILAVPGDGRNPQPFRIYKISKPLNGIVTINAEHISYWLSHIPCSPFSANSVNSALAGLKNNAAEECPFGFWTDKSTLAGFSVTVPSSIRSRLGGAEGSILDVYGGEYEFDNYTVKLHNQRGTDSGVSLRYGKNITDLTQEENIQNTITGVYPYWSGSDGELVILSEKTVDADSADQFPYRRTVPLDCSQDFEEKPTEEELRKRAKDYIKGEGIGIPAVSITVSFVALWQTEEYKDIAPLERVRLCDTVAVEFSELGVSAKAKVIKTVYDVLLDRYESVELGEAKSSLAGTIVRQEQTISDKPSTSFLQQAIEHATELITGASGGYVVLHADGNGQPFEILVMDTPDINTAQNVWRWNKNGWGHSSNGYNGPYALAATLENGIVADFIKAGTLQGVEVIADEGRIGGWIINGQAIYRDVRVGDKVYRVYFQPPLSSAPEKTWVLSCQESTNGGTTFGGNFILFSDGSMKNGNTTISKVGEITSSYGGVTAEMDWRGFTLSQNNTIVAQISTVGGKSNAIFDNVQYDTLNGYAGYTGRAVAQNTSGGTIVFTIKNGIITGVN